jgi:hypothetical protein
MRSDRRNPSVKVRQLLSLPAWQGAAQWRLVGGPGQRAERRIHAFRLGCMTNAAAEAEYSLVANQGRSSSSDVGRDAAAFDKQPSR